MAGPTQIAVGEIDVTEAVAYISGLFAAFHAIAMRLCELEGTKALNEIEERVLATLKPESRGFSGHPDQQKNDAHSMVRQAFRATRNAFDAR